MDRRPPIEKQWGRGKIERAFRDAFMILERRISLLLCLPLARLDKLAIKKEIDQIGQQ